MKEQSASKQRMTVWWSQVSIWHLLVLPKNQRLPIIGIDQFALFIRHHLAKNLGIGHEDSPAEWLIRLFIQPPDKKSPHLLWLPIKLLQLLKFIIGLPVVIITWAVDQFAHRIDVNKTGRKLDAVALKLPILRMGWRFFIVLISLPILISVSTPLSTSGQAAFSAITLMLALFISRIEGRMSRVFLITLSLIATLRYLFWRFSDTLPSDPIDFSFALILIFAELYAVLILLLGYFQTIWPLHRNVADLPADTSDWPTVDIFIPTYNEPLTVLRPTVLAAQLLDWPADKISIYLLDDGRRSEMRDFAASLGVEYIARTENSHAKAGNLNNALKYSTGDFIAIFDCDHVPTKDFLTKTMGWFVKDPQCAIVQTPHHFFSQGPFHKNLGLDQNAPSEDLLFHGLVQDGSDFWNATFFCGSCAVIKRGPLLEIGGIAVETVTEDAHTALKLHRLGYRTAYINQPLAAGLATESLSGHVGQRVRWARGMVQIFRTDNPLLGKGLSIAQRLCYTNSMLHFLYGIPRLIFLLAPMAFLLFDIHLIAASSLMIIAYIFPQLMHASLANSRGQGGFRHSFWSEIYETVLAWYIAVPTTLALINPKLGKFNVTAKGGIIQKTYYDWVIARPYIILIILNVSGLIVGIVRLFWWNAHEPGTVLLNMVWVLFNLVALGVAIGASREHKQLRLSHRVKLQVAGVIYRMNGQAIRAITSDFSMGGLKLIVSNEAGLETGEHIQVALPSDQGEMSFNARVVWTGTGALGVRFESMSMQDEKDLVYCTFARSGAWDETIQVVDKPLSNLRTIGSLCLSAYTELFKLLLPTHRTMPVATGKKGFGA